MKPNRITLYYKYKLYRGNIKEKVLFADQLLMELYSTLVIKAKSNAIRCKSPSITQ